MTEKANGWGYTAVATAGAVLFAFHAFQYWPTFTDDAYVTFRHARNFANGHGLVFNAGERVEGITNLGWALVLAPFASTDPLPVAKGLGLGLGIGTLVVVVAWARSEGLHSAAAAVGIAPLVVLPWAPYWSVQGMETPAVLFLATAGWCLVRAEAEGGRIPVASLALGLAPWFRPDAALSTAATGALVLARWGPCRSVLRGAVLVAVLGILLVSVKLHWYGAILPNTWHAKVGQSFSPRRGVQYLADFVQAPWPPAALMLLGGVVWGLLRPRAQGGLPAAVATAGLLVPIASNGDIFANFRMLVPALPAMGACWALLAERYADGFAAAAPTPGSTGRRMAVLRRLGTVAVAVAIVAPALRVGLVSNPCRTDRFPRTGVDVSPKDSLVWPGHRIHAWDAGYREYFPFAVAWAIVRAPAGDGLAFTEIGVFSWAARGPVTDLLGLTDPVMAGRTGATWAERRAWLLLRARWLLCARTAGLWQAVREDLPRDGWTVVDGCGNTRVFAHPATGGVAQPPGDDSLRERLAWMFDSLPNHHGLHAAALREAMAASASYEVLSWGLRRAESAADGQRPDLFPQLGCDLGIETGCRPRPDLCGGAQPEYRTTALDSDPPSVGFDRVRVGPPGFR